MPDFHSYQKSLFRTRSEQSAGQKEEDRTERERELIDCRRTEGLQEGNRTFETDGQADMSADKLKQVNLNQSPGQQEDDYELVDDAQNSKCTKCKSMLAFPANKPSTPMNVVAKPLDSNIEKLWAKEKQDEKKAKDELKKKALAKIKGIRVDKKSVKVNTRKHDNETNTGNDHRRNKLKAKVEARKNMSKTEMDDSVDIMPSVAEAARMKIRRGSEFGRYSHKYTMSMTKEPKNIVLLPPWPVSDDKKRPDNYNLFEMRNQPFWLFSTPDEQPKGSNKKPYTDLLICMPENKMEKYMGTKLPGKPRDLDPYGSMRRLSARSEKFEENQVTNNTVKTIVDLMNNFGVPRFDAQQPEKAITFTEPQKILTYPRTFGKSHVVKRKDWTQTGAGLCHKKREGKRKKRDGKDAPNANGSGSRSESERSERSPADDDKDREKSSRTGRRKKPS